MSVIDRLTAADLPSFPTLGLYEGHAGFAVLGHVLHKCTGHEMTEKIARSSLQRINEEITIGEGANFAQGITGIAWAIAWLARYQYVAMDVDDILEEIDGFIFKSVFLGPEKNIALDRGAIGKAFYFLMRIQHGGPQRHRFKHITYREVLVMLTDDILRRLNDYFPAPDYDIAAVMSSSDRRYVILHAAWVLNTALSLRINTAAVEKGLYRIAFSLQRYVSNSNNPTEARFMAGWMLLMAGVDQQVLQWEKEGKEQLLQIWNTAVENIPDMDPATHVQWMKMLSLADSRWPLPVWREGIQLLWQAMEVEQLPLTFVGGVGTVLIAVLGADGGKPGWDELLLLN